MAEYHISLDSTLAGSRRACASLQEGGDAFAVLIQKQDLSNCWFPPGLTLFSTLWGEQIEGAKQAFIELFDLQVKWAGETGKPAKDSEEPKWMNKLKQ